MSGTMSARKTKSQERPGSPTFSSTSCSAAVNTPNAATSTPCGAAAPPTSTAPPIPTAPTISKTCPLPRSTSHSGSNPTAWVICSARSTRKLSTLGVVQTEKRQGENQPYGVTRELITKNTYPAGHPYSWTTIGEMADLDAASLTDVKEWFKTYYGPSNVVLVLAGDIDVKTAREKVTKYFGDIPAGPPVAHQEVWIAKMTGTHRQTVQDRVPQARIYKVWNIPEYGSAEGDYLGLVSDCLS